jgi:ComEC/Rec2-related protein
MGGIAFPLHMTYLILLCVVTAGLTIAYLAYQNQHSFVSTSLVIAVLCVAGYTVSSLRMHYIYKQHAQFTESVQGNTFDAIATITSTDAIDHPFYSTCISLELISLRKKSSKQWVSCNKVIQIYTRKSADLRSVLVGDTVGINDITFKKMNNADFGKHLLKEGIAATLFIPDCLLVHIHRPEKSSKRMLFYMRQRIVDALKHRIDPRTYQLFISIFLGNKQSPKYLSEKTKEHFNTWGVTHYLARSGLHMVIFIIIWQFLFSFLPLPRLLKEIVLMLLCILYCMLSWASVSFNRAFLTCILYRTCTLLRLQTNFLHLLTIVCLLILVENPLHLFFLDFQLSFGLTWALALFNHIQTHHKHQRLQTIASL